MLILKLSEEDEEEIRVTTCIMTLRWFRNQNLEVGIVSFSSGLGHF